MVKQNLNAEENIDDYLEQLLDIQRKKNVKLEKKFKENSEAWQEFMGH